MKAKIKLNPGTGRAIYDFDVREKVVTRVMNENEDAELSEEQKLWVAIMMRRAIRFYLQEAVLEVELLPTQTHNP